MDNETLSIVLTLVGMAAALIWLIIRLATKPLEVLVKTNGQQLQTVVDNNTAAMTRIYTILDRHECELKDHSEHIAALDERTQKPARKRTA
jgi:membrane peptidoglycan carboxypeptidase